MTGSVDRYYHVAAAAAAAVHVYSPVVDGVAAPDVLVLAVAVLTAPVDAAVVEAVLVAAVVVEAVPVVAVEAVLVAAVPVAAVEAVLVAAFAVETVPVAAVAGNVAAAGLVGVKPLVHLGQPHIPGCELIPHFLIRCLNIYKQEEIIIKVHHENVWKIGCLNVDN